MASKTAKAMQPIERFMIRAVTPAVLSIAIAIPMRGQSRSVRKTNPPSPCGDESSGIPGFYYEGVVDQFKPPGFKSALITITEGAEEKLVLMTDGTKFELWSGTPQTPQKSVNRFLLDLDQACRLPADPANAAKLIHVNWESSEISSTEFGQLHHAFILALSQFASNADERYTQLLTEKMLSMHLDTVQYPITYDNAYERVEVWVWNGPAKDSDKAMLDWLQTLRRLAENRFHHPFPTP